MKSAFCPIVIESHSIFSLVIDREISIIVKFSNLAHCSFVSLSDFGRFDGEIASGMRGERVKPPFDVE